MTVCRDGYHQYYTDNPQRAYIGRREVVYYVCACGRSVVYDDIIMSMEEFCDTAKEYKA